MDSLGNMTSEISGVNVMNPITVHLPQPYITALDELVRQELYPTRAEAIRAAIRDMLIREMNGIPKSN